MNLYLQPWSLAGVNGIGSVSGINDINGIDGMTGVAGVDEVVGVALFCTLLSSLQDL